MYSPGSKVLQDLLTQTPITDHDSQGAVYTSEPVAFNVRGGTDLPDERSYKEYNSLQGLFYG